MNMKSQQTRRPHSPPGGRRRAGSAEAVPALRGVAAAVPKRAGTGKSAESAGLPVNGAVLGAKLRAERERRGITVREMARRVDVSASLVSQIERGLVTPSVGTLWSMTAELGLAMDGLFIDTEHGDAAEPSPRAAPRRSRGVVQHGHDRQHIRLAGGVVWERLTAQADDEVEFLYVRYEAGAESCPENSFFRHGGKEYAYILEGRLGLQIGFERYELSPGDSVSFESHNPHRLWAIGDKPAIAIWVIIDRTNDNRP